MEGLERILREQPFFCRICRRAQRADRRLRPKPSFRGRPVSAARRRVRERVLPDPHGRVALEIKAPGRAPAVFATLGEGDIVGASWLVPPYRWTSDARALELTRALGIDAACLRRKCEADHHLGYEMMKRFVPILVNRLHATQLQMLDVYAKR